MYLLAICMSFGGYIYLDLLAIYFFFYILSFMSYLYTLHIKPFLATLLQILSSIHYAVFFVFLNFFLGSAKTFKFN